MNAAMVVRTSSSAGGESFVLKHDKVRVLKSFHIPVHVYSATCVQWYIVKKKKA